MKRKVRVLPTAMLRALLLGALILFVLGVLGLYLLGRSAREPVLRPLESPLDDREEPLLLAGEGFEYEVTHEGKKLFEIRADRLLSAREDSFVLQGVSLAVERDDGGRYAISSTHGEYEKESEAALLEGFDLAIDAAGSFR